MRRFEYTDDKSSKFWEIEQSGLDLNIRWGRIGTAGQSQTKNFADEAKAGAALQKLVTEKTSKGYVENGAATGDAAAGAATAPAAVSPTKPPPPRPATARRTAAPAASATQAPETSADLPSPAAPAEGLDEQIDRAFEAICAQIAEGTVPDGSLTVARIRRTHGIGELAATQVNKLLIDAGLIWAWQSALTSNAKKIAAEIASRRGAAPGASSPAATPPGGVSSDASTGELAPWLAQGEPLRLGGAGDHTRVMARPTRRHPQPVEAVDAQRSWLQLRNLIGSQVEPDFAGSDAGLRATFEAAWQTLSSPKLGGTPETDAVLLAVCLSRYRRNALDVKFVDYLVARHGLPYVIDVLLHSMAYAVGEKYVYQGKNPVLLTYRTAEPSNVGYHSPLSEGEWRLRACLAAAAQDIYDACADEVGKRMGEVVPEMQIKLALLFPDRPEMTHALLERLCAGDAKPPSLIYWLQLNATDPAALARARKVKADGYSSFWDQADMVSTVLLEHRVDAVRWLAPGADQEQAGEALARIGTPEALDALARVASTSKTALTRFQLAVERWPVAATAALARLLAGGSKDQGLLQPALLELLRRHPALPSELRPWLEPAANTLLETLRARLAGPAEVAPTEELPEVLANVPWLQAKKKAAKSLQLSPLPLAPIERWDEGEKEAALELSAWQKNRYESAMRSPDGMAHEIGFNHEKRLSAQAASFKAARDAIAKKDLDGLIAAWRGMSAAKRQANSSSGSIDGVALTYLPPELGIPFWNAMASEAPCYGVSFVAATWGIPALPGVIARITNAPSDHLGLALRIGAVDIGPVAARTFVKLKKHRAAGREWLKRFPEHAACALIAPALGKPCEARDCAAAALRYLAGSGHAALLEEVAGRYGQPDVLPALHAMLNESPLDRYPNKRAALPEFWKPSGWNRPVLHNGKALSDAALETLGTMMTFPTTEEVYAGLHQVKAACTAQSLADFAWDCFSAWLNASAPSKENWAMLGLGVLGNDDTARKLTPLIRTWPGEAAHARAVTGLDVLATIGSDVALMLLNGIAQKIKFKGLQDKAREKIEAIAEARGLTPEELEDRLAPDLGLDEQGSLVLDFGPRAFKVGFDEALKPYVREWQDGKAGARLPDLPKPKKTDDEELAKAAVERFKLLKKDARTIASQQVLRLEAAMCARRRWSADVFAQFLAGHPLVRHLVRRLVWGVYAMPVETIGEGEEEEKRVASYGGTLQACFRVSEDGEYTDAADDPFTLPEGEHYRIGLPHALELPADQAAEFGQLLADYELLQPFAQLGRDTYALTEEERKAVKLLRWKDVEVATGKVLGLSNIGWRRGPAQDGGCIWTFDKPADPGLTLELTLDPGIIVGLVDEYPEQKLGEITLGRAHRSSWAKDEELSTFDTLDPIVASELIRDMERLRS